MGEIVRVFLISTLTWGTRLEEHWAAYEVSSKDKIVRKTKLSQNKGFEPSSQFLIAIFY